MRKLRKTIVLMILIVPLININLFGRTIKGLVIDDLDFEPIPLVNIIINDTVKIGETKIYGDHCGTFDINLSDSIYIINFEAIGFEPTKVLLCEKCEYIEVIMFQEANEDFITLKDAKKKKKKRFNKIGKKRKEAYKRGIFRLKKPCYKQFF